MNEEKEFMTDEEWEEKKFKRLLGTIFYICNLAGFRIEGRITLVDKKSGRIWR